MQKLQKTALPSEDDKLAILTQFLDLKAKHSTVYPLLFESFTVG